MTTDQNHGSVGNHTDSSIKFVESACVIVASLSLGFASVTGGYTVVSAQFTDPLVAGSSSLSSILAFVATVGVLVVVSSLMSIGFDKFSLEEIRDFHWAEGMGIAGITGVMIGIFVVCVSLTGVGLEFIASPDGNTVKAGLLLLAIGGTSLGWFHEFYSPTIVQGGENTDSNDDVSIETIQNRAEHSRSGWSTETEDSAGEKYAGPPDTPEGHISWKDTRGAQNDGDATHTGDTNDANGEDTSSDQSGNTELTFDWQTDTGVTFNDVGGMGDLKKELTDEVIRPLTTQSEKAEKLGVTASNIVFHGPPGTGKTFMAKALAAELGLPFTKLSGADVQSKWINESSEMVKELFTEATGVADEAGGAVVFLDELDSVLSDRGAGSSHEEDSKVVNEFLNRLEDTGEQDILFIGATNRLESLDEAGIRAGRIDKKIHIGKPDRVAREKILQAQLCNRPSDVSEAAITKVAKETDSKVASDIELIVENAAKGVLVRDGDKISEADLMSAVNTM